MILDCDFIEPHQHILPDDWQFGGASGTDPRVDPRFQPSIYEYFNARIERIHVTVVPFCDMEALDYCTLVSGWGPGYSPVWVAVKRPGEKFEMLPWTYDKSTDEVTPRATA